MASASSVGREVALGVSVGSDSGVEVGLGFSVGTAGGSGVAVNLGVASIAVVVGTNVDVSLCSGVTEAPCTTFWSAPVSAWAPRSRWLASRSGQPSRVPVLTVSVWVEELEC